MSTPLNDYMKREKLGDADFAALIGKDRTIVNRIRRGIVRPTLDVAAAIEKSTDGAIPMQAWTPSSNEVVV